MRRYASPSNLSDIECGIYVVNDGKCTRYYTLPTREQCDRIMRESLGNNPKTCKSYKVHTELMYYSPLLYITSNSHTTGRREPQYIYDFRLMQATGGILPLTPPHLRCAAARANIPEDIREILEKSNGLLFDPSSREEQLESIFKDHQDLFKKNRALINLHPTARTYARYFVSGRSFHVDERVAPSAWQPLLLNPDEERFVLSNQLTKRPTTENIPPLTCTAQQSLKDPGTDRYLHCMKVNGGVMVHNRGTSKNPVMWYSIPTWDDQYTIMRHILKPNVCGKISCEVTRLGAPVLCIERLNHNQFQPKSTHCVFINLNQLHNKKPRASDTELLKYFSNIHLPYDIAARYAAHNVNLNNLSTRNETLISLFPSGYKYMASKHIHEIQSTKCPKPQTFNIYGVYVHPDGNASWVSVHSNEY